MTAPERTELSQPLTPAEEHAVALLSQGLTYRQIAEALGCSHRTARNHIENAAAKIPGDLPLQHRAVNWYRGGKVWTFPPET